MVALGSVRQEEKNLLGDFAKVFLEKFVLGIDKGDKR